MPYHPRSFSHDTQREPVFVVFRKGDVVDIGNAKELQRLFNQRHRALKLQLLALCDGDDDEQMSNKYQVMRLKDWEQLKVDTVAHADACLAEAQDAFVAPDDDDEFELLFNPNDAALRSRIARRNSRYFRYYRKHKVARWIANEAFPANTEIVLTDGEQQSIIQITDDASIKRCFEQRELEQAAKAQQLKSDKWRDKLTPIEQEHKEKRRERLAKHQPASIWY